jgi:pseudomonalisin
MLSSVRVRSFVVALVLAAAQGVATFGQQPAKSVDRVIAPIDDRQVVTLAGNVHPLAHGEFDLGPVAGGRMLDRMVLELEPSPAQQAELDVLLEAQHNPESPLYQQWLKPAEFGARFGASAADVARVTAWLRGHGFTVNEVTASKRLVIFSGTAAEVAETFHTELHRYKVDGVEHIANAQDPQIPAALAGVVGGVLSLHDFRRTSEIRSRKALGARPAYSSGATHYLFPADWATIYDLNPLYSAGNTGTGTSIAIVGRSDIVASDVSQFRSTSGLPANAPNVILVGADPGLVAGDEDESTLDVEWSGAIAPSAKVNFVVGASTSTTD